MSWVVGIVTVDDVGRATEFEIAGILFEVAHAQMFFDICKRGRSYITKHKFEDRPPAPHPNPFVML